MTVVTLDGLSRNFGTAIALDSVSLTVEHASFVSLLGPSGCGKSTTLRLIAGFDRCDSGRILFDGEDVAGLPPERRDIGMVFQSYALFPHMTVAQNVAFGLEMRRISKNDIRIRVARALDLVRLDGRADRFPKQLSGGQQQRVALARALVIEPRILLLDEPLANLDSTLRSEMCFFIRELQQRVGITTLFVTHDQSEAMAVSDQIVVMSEGRVVQMAPPLTLYEQPVTADIARFIGRANLLKADPAAGGFAQTCLGTMKVHPDARSVSGPFIGMLRPEQISLLPPGTEDTIPAQITFRQYGGHLTEYRACVPDGTEVDIQLSGPPAFGLGDMAGLALRDGWLWPVEPGKAPL